MILNAPSLCAVHALHMCTQAIIGVRAVHVHVSDSAISKVALHVCGCLCFSRLTTITYMYFYTCSYRETEDNYRHNNKPTTHK